MDRRDPSKVSFEQKDDNELAISSAERTGRQQEHKQRFWGKKQLSSLDTKKGPHGVGRKYGGKGLRWSFRWRQKPDHEGQLGCKNSEFFKRHWELVWPDASFLKHPFGYYMENSLGGSEVPVGRLVTKLLQWTEWHVTAVLTRLVPTELKRNAKGEVK